MPDAAPVLYLTDAVLETLDMTPNAIANAIEAALAAKAAGALHTAPKSAILPGDGRYAMATLAVGGDGFIVVKQVTVCPDNPARGLPSINGAIMVLDAATGLLRAVLGANWITAARTAGLSLVAARRLADPASQTMAFVGTGVQARSHLAAFAQAFPLRRIRMAGRGRANLDALATMAAGLGLEAEISDSPEAALRDADIVVTSITLEFSTPPFLDARWLKPRAFAAITDACIPWRPDAMDAFGAIIVDDRAQEAQSANPMVDPARITGDLTELTAGALTPPGDAPRAFAFRGLSLGDYAAAVLAVRRAQAAGAGVPLSPQSKTVSG